MDIKVKAFLDLIAKSEGTFGHGDDGYNVLVGGKLFHDYSRHPNITVDLGRGLKSTAAGRYQILHRYAVAYSASLALPDFGHESQDAIALQMIHERGAIPLITGGHIRTAIARCSNIWASFPDNGYGQNAHSIEQLLAWYNESL